MAWVLVVVLLVVAAGLGWALRVKAAATRRLTLERDDAMAGKGAAEARLPALEAEAEAGRRASEARLAAVAAQAETQSRLTALEARAGADHDAARARLISLWSLAQLDQQRAWRLSLASAIEADGHGLPGALAMEVDRIREEVGTPGALAMDVQPPVAAHDAALALLAARELLAVLVPHTQAYDISVAREGSGLVIEVVCTGWEGPAAAADDVSRLLTAVAPAGGDLQLEADDDGRLRARLQLPLAG